MSPYGHTEMGTSTTTGGGGGGMGGAGQMIGMGAKLLTGLMGLSDEDEKTNIQPVGAVGETPLYAYDYKADVEAAKKSGRPMPPKRVGPMAQDLPQKSTKRLKAHGRVKGRRVVDFSQLGMGV